MIFRCLNGHFHHIFDLVLDHCMVHETKFLCQKEQMCRVLSESNGREKFHRRSVAVAIDFEVLNLNLSP